MRESILEQGNNIPKGLRLTINAIVQENEAPLVEMAQLLTQEEIGDFLLDKLALKRVPSMKAEEEEDNMLQERLPPGHHQLPQEGMNTGGVKYPRTGGDEH